MQTEKLNEDNINTLLEKLLKRSPISYGKYEASVNEIIGNVRENGDKAVFELEKKFDKVDLNPDNIRVTKEEIDEAYTKVDEKLLTVIRKSLKNIRA
ncbi:MAG: histidinol dehydrogenase, partial [Lachnospiraceae bacterium]|nr:histidinol dehydrogenase [Lachnospiraceae bacterium]